MGRVCLAKIHSSVLQNSRMSILVIIISHVTIILIIRIKTERTRKNVRDRARYICDSIMDNSFFSQKYKNIRT